MRDGKHCLAEGKIEKAIEIFTKATKKNPDDPKAHELLGNAYYKLMQNTYRQFATNSKQLEQINRQGNELADLAVFEYKEALRNDEKNWEIRYRVAIELFNKREYKEAISELQKTIKYNPKFAVAYSVLAESFLGIGEYDMALKYIKSAHNINKDDEEYFFSLGKAYYFIGDKNKGFEMEAKLKHMNSTYYQNLLDYRFSNEKQP